jgi:phosphoribosylpyrophosphate synthetase
MSHVCYLSNLTPERFDKTVKRMVKLIRENYPTANVLAGRGLSSSMIIPTLAAKMKLEWAIVRKGKTHSDYKVEVSHRQCDGDGKTYVVLVDDLIDSGNTYRRVKQAVRSKYNEVKVEAVFLGAACYESHRHPILKDKEI